MVRGQGSDGPRPGTGVWAPCLTAGRSARVQGRRRSPAAPGSRSPVQERQRSSAAPGSRSRERPRRGGEILGVV
jgi:hypothetical protein